MEAQMRLRRIARTAPMWLLLRVKEVISFVSETRVHYLLKTLFFVFVAEITSLCLTLSIISDLFHILNVSETETASVIKYKVDSRQETVFSALFIPPLLSVLHQLSSSLLPDS
jgi:hypothetical protein